MTMKKLRITPGFLLLAAVLFYMDEGVGILPWGLLACALHELGHYAAGRMYGGRLRWMELSAVGAQLSLDYPRPLSYGRELVVALAGPAVNLVLGWTAIRIGCFLLAGVSFGLGIFNLMPIISLDGGRALWCGLSLLVGEDSGERLLVVTSGILIGLLAGIAVIAAVRYANFTLLITTLWLLWITLQAKKKKRGKNSLLFGK